MAPPTMPTPQYKSPKLTVIALSNIAVSKVMHRWYETLILAFLSGAHVCFGAMLAISIAGGMSPGITTVLKMPALQKLMFGCLFPVALMLILITGTELITGNMMTMTIGVITKKIKPSDLVKNWFIVYFGNWFGCAVTAYFLGYLTVFYTHEPYISYLMTFIELKCVTLGWGEVFLRGIGCNWLVCLAVFLAISSEDISSKLQSSFWPIMAFASIGFEHCVANMFTVTLAFMIKTGYADESLFPAIKDITYGHFIGKNLIPATLGNLVGGIVFVALAQYIAYGVEHTDHRLKTVEDKHHKRKALSKLAGLPIFHWHHRHHLSQTLPPNHPIHALTNSTVGTQIALAMAEEMSKKNGESNGMSTNGNGNSDANGGVYSNGSSTPSLSSAAPLAPAVSAENLRAKSPTPLPGSPNLFYPVNISNGVGSVVVPQVVNRQSEIPVMIRAANLPPIQFSGPSSL